MSLRAVEFVAGQAQAMEAASAMAPRDGGR